MVELKDLGKAGAILAAVYLALEAYEERKDIQDIIHSDEPLDEKVRKVVQELLPEKEASDLLKFALGLTVALLADSDLRSQVLAKVGLAEQAEA